MTIDWERDWPEALDPETGEEPDGFDGAFSSDTAQRWWDEHVSGEPDWTNDPQ